MNFSTDKPGRNIGSIIALQCLVGQLLARCPDANEIFSKMESFSDGLEPSGDESPAQFDFLADIAGGAREMIDEVRNITEQARDRLK
jgi:hypothetical protein